MTLVVDASVVAAALLGIEANAAWAESMLLSDRLAAPHLMPAEVANVLRRRMLLGDITHDTATQAHGELRQMTFALHDYDEFADRVWELRDNVTVYDAWYIALAEALDASLATLDQRLARAPGARCLFLTPLS